MNLGSRSFGHWFPHRRGRFGATGIAVFVGLWCLTTAPAEESIKLAVLYGSAEEGYGGLLESEFSGRDGIQVLEREALPALLKESKLGLEGIIADHRDSLGLLGADAAIFIELAQSDSGEALVTFRLVDAETGVVLASFFPPPGKPFTPSEEWAFVVANRFIAAVRNSAGMTASPVSILGIRASGLLPSLASRRIQREVASILPPRLAAESGLFIAERDRLGDLEFEKMLRVNEATSQFWTGAWLLEGSIEEAESNGATSHTLDVRLVGADGKEAGHWRTSVSSGSKGVIDAVDEVASKIAAHLRAAHEGNSKNNGAETSPVRWNLADEAIAFRKEAEWAVGQTYYKEAARAARASIALGSGTRRLEHRLLIEALAGYAGHLAHWKSVKEEQNYEAGAAAAEECLADLADYIQEQPRNDLEVLRLIDKVANAAHSALYACWLKRNALNESETNAVRLFRDAFRDVAGRIDGLIESIPATERGTYGEVSRWKRVKGLSFGLWQESGEDYLTHWVEGFQADRGLCPLPYLHGAELMPANADWDLKGVTTNVIEDWRLLAESLSVSNDPQLKMRGWIIRRELQTFVALPPEMISRRVKPSTDLSWIRETKGSEGLSLIRNYPSEFPKVTGGDCFLIPILSAIRDLSDVDEETWKNSGGPDAVALIVRTLQSTDTLEPMVSEFALGKQGGLRSLPSTKLTGMRWPREDWVLIAKTFRDYEKRMLARGDPKDLKVYFVIENETILREKLLSPATSRKADERAVLTLSVPFRTGNPLPLVAPYNPINFFGKFLNGPEYFTAQLNWSVAYGERECTGIKLERLNVNSGNRTKYDFPPPTGLDEQSTFMTVSAVSLFPSGEGGLLVGIATRKGKEPGKFPTEAFLIHLDADSGASHYFDLGEATIFPRTHVDSRGIAYIERQSKIDSGGGAAVNPMMTFENNVVLFTYDPATRKLIELANNLRRPATNFLDDRAGYSPSYFGPGPWGSVVCTGWFPLERGGKLFTPSTLIWKPELNDWAAPDFEMFEHSWSGKFLPQSGQLLTFAASANILVEIEGQSKSLLGRTKESQYWYPPSKLCQAPIASVASSTNTIQQGATATLPDGGLYVLFARPNAAGGDRPLLRCFHPELGRQHFDVEIEIADPPALSRPVSPTPSRVNPSPPSYRWELQAAGTDLVLISQQPAESFVYRIPHSELLSKLKNLHAVKETLTEFETIPADLLASSAYLTEGIKEEDVVDAIRRDDVETLRRQVEKGLRFDVELGDHALYPLHLAAFFGKAKAVAFFLQAGSDPNALCQKVPALVYSVRGGNLECIREMLKAEGIRIDRDLSSFSLPLVWEALQTRDDAVFDLIWRHLNPDDSNLSKTLETVSVLARDRGKISIMTEAKERLATLREKP